MNVYLEVAMNLTLFAFLFGACIGDYLSTIIFPQIPHSIFYIVGGPSPSLLEL